MWDRVILKQRGKEAFQRNYWKCVLVAFILMLFVGSNGSTANHLEVTKKQNNDAISQITETFDYGGLNSMTKEWKYSVSRGSFFDYIQKIFSSGVVLVSSIVVLLLSVIGFLLNIFVFAPLEVGGNRFFIENAYQPANPGNLMFPFKSGSYGNVVLNMFLRGLYIALWSLLLVIPGIIKSYEYRMVPYLLAECPEMSSADAFRISKELMYGQKMNAFVLDLSFIGWGILSACTCGLVGIFFASPYQHATNAELFLELKRQYFAGQNQSNMYY